MAAATVLMIAPVAMETGGVKNSPRASAALGAAVWLLIPMAISRAQVSSNPTYWIVSNDCYGIHFARKRDSLALASPETIAGDP